MTNTLESSPGTSSPEIAEYPVLEMLRKAGENLRFPGCQVSFGLRNKNRQGCSFSYAPGSNNKESSLKILIPPGKSFEEVYPSLVTAVIKGSRRAGRRFPEGSKSVVSESMKSLSLTAKEGMISLVDAYVNSQQQEQMNGLIVDVDEAYHAFKLVCCYNEDGSSSKTIKDAEIDDAFSTVFDFLSAFRDETTTSSEGMSN